ncbi:hypothetical protein [Moraxella lacunata]
MGLLRIIYIMLNSKYRTTFSQPHLNTDIPCLSPVCVWIFHNNSS